MSTVTTQDGLRASWGWMMVLGIVLLLLGAVAAGAAVTTTMITLVILGTLIIIGGVIHLIGALRELSTGRIWLHLLSGILYVVFGVLIVYHPAVGGAVLTLMLAILLLVGGIYRVAAAASLRLPSWGWAVASGVIDMMLAVMLLTQWPASGFWFIGLCIGIALIFQGWSWIMIAFMLKKLV
jgi:uncharacterized membrane protein HdeD (DUF308 family)